MPDSSLIAAAQEFASTRALEAVEFKGKGSFKETFRVVKRPNQPLALKLLRPDRYDPSRSQREINAMRRCNCTMIAKLYDYGDFVCRDGTKYYFSIEEY